MPLYDFACRACGQVFEELQPFEAPPPACPTCSGGETERRASSFSRPRPAASRDPSWTPAATRGDAIRAGRHHHH